LHGRPRACWSTVSLRPLRHSRRFFHGRQLMPLLLQQCQDGLQCDLASGVCIAPKVGAGGFCYPGDPAYVCFPSLLVLDTTQSLRLPYARTDSLHLQQCAAGLFCDNNTYSCQYPPVPNSPEPTTTTTTTVAPTTTTTTTTSASPTTTPAPSSSSSRPFGIYAPVHTTKPIANPVQVTCTNSQVYAECLRGAEYAYGCCKDVRPAFLPFFLFSFFSLLISPSVTGRLNVLHHPYPQSAGLPDRWRVHPVRLRGFGLSVR
jgi:hypothetical protein